MIFRLILLTILALISNFAVALACEDHYEAVPEEWAVENQEELPHAEGPMIPSVDTVEFLADIDEDGAPTGSATLRIQFRNGTVDPNLDEVALTLYHSGGRPLAMLYADLTDDRVLEFTLTDIDNVFDGEWSGYLQGIDADGVWGEMGGLFYVEPVRVHSTPQEPVDESDAYHRGHDDMMGCDTTNTSTGTGLPVIIGVTAFFLSLIRRRLTA